MDDPNSSKKLELIPLASDSDQTKLTPADQQKLHQLLAKFCENADQSVFNAIHLALGRFEQQVVKNSEQDWRLNPIILDAIFNHLPLPDLKYVRLVCKLWAQVAAPILTRKSVFTYVDLCDRGDYRNLARKNRGVDVAQLRQYLLEENYRILFESNFHLRHVEMRLFHHGIPDLPDLFTTDRFRHVTSLRLCGFSSRLTFNLLLPYWLPTYWRNLKRLKLVDPEQMIGSGEEDNLQLPTQQPPTIDVELESLVIEFDIPNLRHSSWNFLNNCPKLKHINLMEVIRQDSRLAQQPNTSNILPRHQTNIIESLKNFKLETLKLRFLSKTKDCHTFFGKLVSANAKTLKRLELELFLPRDPSEEPEYSKFLERLALQLTKTLPPSVQVFRLGLEWFTSWVSMILYILPTLHFYQQTSANLKKLELISFCDKLTIVVRSPTHIILRHPVSNKIDTCEKGYRTSSANLAEVELRRQFPKVNYACCAFQTSADAGISITTTILETFGTDGVFNLEKLKTEWEKMAFESDTSAEDDIRAQLFNISREKWTNLKLLDFGIIREVAVGFKGWAAEDLITPGEISFVFGRVPQSRMSKAWDRVQRSARFCSATSVEEGVTPEVVSSGQGSHAFYRTFTTRVGETFEEMCQRFS